MWRILGDLQMPTGDAALLKRSTHMQETGHLSYGFEAKSMPSATISHQPVLAFLLRRLLLDLDFLRLLRVLHVLHILYLILLIVVISLVTSNNIFE